MMRRILIFLRILLILVEARLKSKSRLKFDDYSRIMATLLVFVRKSLKEEGTENPSNANICIRLSEKLLKLPEEIFEKKFEETSRNKV